MSNDRTDPEITVTPNGPYLVSGDLPVVRRRIVTSEHGEPLVWQTTTTVDTPARTALCRCGGSANKPFCDGTHARAGFDGTEADAPAPYDERSTSYPGTHVIVRDDRAICVHAGFCANRATNVWTMAGSGTQDSVVRSQMMGMIDRCPSGALTYRLEPDGPDIEADLVAEIGVVDDGPLYVTGGVPVRRSDGTVMEARNRQTLCRCGASSNKPLCDGSHAKAGFRDAAPEHPSGM
ncbi:MAG: CDGSH iron-sulfur domain-containing protein [Acidimicrobiales bacterium]